MSLLFNMLSRLDIAFLSRRKPLSISWLQSPPAVILETKKIKSLSVSIVSPSICHDAMGLGVMILGFWILSFSPAFSLSSLTSIQRLFSSSLTSALCVVSSACLRLVLAFLLAILTPVCASSSLACHMMHSVHRLNGQGDNIQPDVLLPHLGPGRSSKSSCSYCFFTCIWISQETGQVVWYSHLLKDFPQFVVIHTVKGFSAVNEADVFLEFACFLHDQQMLAIDLWGFTSGSSSYCWRASSSMKNILLKPSLKDFEHNLAGMWSEYNHTVIWAFFGTALLWD